MLDNNVGACVAGVFGSLVLAEAGYLQLGAGVLLQGFSFTLLGVTFTASAPVSARGIVAGAMLEGTGVVTEGAALGLVYETCVRQ